MSNEPDYPEWVRPDYVISGVDRIASPPRVPKMRTKRGVAGYVGNVDLYEPRAPSVRLVDPMKEARDRVQPVVLAALGDELISEIDLWLDMTGEAGMITDVVRNALHDLLDPGYVGAPADDEPEAKELPAPERNKERRPRRTKGSDPTSEETSQVADETYPPRPTVPNPSVAW